MPSRALLVLASWALAAAETADSAHSKHTRLTSIFHADPENDENDETYADLEGFTNLFKQTGGDMAEKWKIGTYHRTHTLLKKVDALKSQCAHHLEITEMDEPHVDAFTKALDDEEGITKLQHKQQNAAPKPVLLTIKHKASAAADSDMDLERETQPAKKKARALLNFGFHGRELIVSETALRFVEMVCGKAQPKMQKEISKILEKVDLQVVPVACPSARVLAESNSCQRVSAHGEDLNRNWAVGWEDGDSYRGSDQYRGASKQSSSEAAALAEVVKKHKPHLYLDVHSGARLLMTPFAHQDGKPRDFEKVMSNLQKINYKHCLTSTKGIGQHKPTLYQAHGTSIDYMHEMGWTGEMKEKSKQQGVPFPLLFELFVNSREDVDEDKCTKEWVDSQDLSLEREYDDSWTDMRLGRNRDKEKMQGMSMERREEEERSCFEQFNPGTKSEYERTVTKWSKAFLTLLGQLGDGAFPLTAKDLAA